MTTIFLDFETYFDTKFSLTKMTTMEYVRDPRFKVWGMGYRFIDDTETTWLSEDEVEDFIRIVPWEDTAVIAHNAMFDAYILTQYYNVQPRYYYDTAAMARGRWPGQSARLADVAERLFPDNPDMRKGEELINAKGIVDLPPDIEQQIAGYCQQDVDLTYAIFEEMWQDYPPQEMDLINMTTRMFVEPTLMVDRERLTKYRDNEITNSEQLIAASGIDRKILSSNQQFTEYLKTEYNINAPTKKSPTTGEQIPALGKNDAGYKQLCSKHPELQHIWDARVAVKSRIAETRAQRFLDACNEDGTLSVPLRYYAAHTGRFGGTEKINMQNLPRGSEIRKSLIAPPGSLVYVADLSNIEARMLAWIADETDLLAAFARNEDVYSQFASHVYGRPIDKHNDPTERFVGKTAILGLGYGMGANKFQATLKSGAMGPAMEFTTEQAHDVVNTYRSTYPGIPLFWDRANDILKWTIDSTKTDFNYRVFTIKPNAIGLPNGMALSYPQLKFAGINQYSYVSRNKTEYTWGGRITENIIQALARIVITDGIARIATYIEPLGGRVVLTVHDEIVCVAPEAGANTIMDNIIELMCIAPEWAPELPLAAEGGYDKAYSK